jgi:phosphate transport system substrate-binding protein
MLKKISFLSMAALTVFSAQAATAREQIRAVGSSTVYPLTTAVAEEFSKKTSFKTPIVESTGTGGGFKLFCAGAGIDTPDIQNASRPIKDSERAQCKKNGVTNIGEIKIGYDGIVIANSVKAPQYKLTVNQLFLALARQVPKEGKLVANPYHKWSDIDAALPATNIEVYGPPPTSGTRDAFVELVMDKACKSSEYKAVYKDEKACGLIREDGKYIEAGENDNLIVQKLISNPDALGIFGYSFLEENREKVQASAIDGKAPELEDITDGSYPVARSLFVYVKNDHIGKVPGIKEFITEYTSKNAIGQEGYLVAKGLVPLPEKEREAVAKAATK